MPRPTALSVLWTSWFAFWLVLALVVTSLDFLGIFTIEHTESFPGETIPPNQLTAFDFFGGMAALFVTIPLEWMKACLLTGTAQRLNIDPAAPFRDSDTMMALANAGFDLGLCLSFPAAFTILYLGSRIVAGNRSYSF
jgi:hypothetical protein